MPRTELVFYCEADGTVPLVEWLDGRVSKVREKCLVRLERLEELGHELRRPEADYLRDGIHELRIRHRSINYRMLYFFHGNRAVVVSHGLVKEATVPPREIEKAVARKRLFERDAGHHTFRPEVL